MKEEKPVTAQKGIVLTESYDYETPDLQYAKQAKALGYSIYAYDPNPGIEQLFLPYFFQQGRKRRYIERQPGKFLPVFKSQPGQKCF